jgi:hypothetical protein
MLSRAALVNYFTYAMHFARLFFVFLRLQICVHTEPYRETWDRSMHE